MRCGASKTNGEPCGALAARGASLCRYHDPEQRKSLIEAAKRGGHNSRRYLPLEIEQPKTLQQVSDALGLVANKLALGTLKAREAELLIRALTAQLEALKVIQGQASSPNGSEPQPDLFDLDELDNYVLQPSPFHSEPQSSP